MRLTRLAYLLVLLGAAGRAGVVSSAMLGYRGEPGVESKLLAAVEVDASPLRFLRIDAGLSFNLLENSGLGAAAVGIGAEVYEPVGLSIRLAGQHQRWNDWRAGENRAFVTLEAEPVPGLEAGFGLLRRVPVFGDEYRSPLVWTGDAAEWNLLYRLRWKFVRKADWWLRAGFSSYHRYTAHSPQQFPLEADGGYRLSEEVELVARAGTAIVGYSGGLVSLHEVELTAGARYDF